MQTPIEIRFRPAYFVVLTLLSPLTLFLLPILMPFEWRKWPRLLDQEGVAEVPKWAGARTIPKG